MLCDAPARKPRTHASHTAPPLPGRDHSRSPSTRVHVCLPRAPLTVVAHDSGPDRRVTALYETMFGSTSTCSSRAFQRYHPQVRQPPPWLSTFESGVQNQVRPPLLTDTLCPDRGTADPSCTPSHVPRAAQAPVHRMPHPPSPGGTSSPPRARAYPSAALLPSHGRCTRLRSGLATHGAVRDDVRLYQYVLIESVPTVPSSSLTTAALAFDFRVARSEPRAPAPSHRHPLP